MNKFENIFFSSWKAGKWNKAGVLPWRVELEIDWCVAGQIVLTCDADYDEQAGDVCHWHGLAGPDGITMMIFSVYNCIL